MTDITIPQEARMAATEAYSRTGGCIVSTIRAALKAWPGAMRARDALEEQPHLILSLPPQEKQDGE